MHDDQLAVDPDVVAALVATQFPAWAGLPVRPVPGAGTVNAIFRIGDRLAARFPLRPGEPDAVRSALTAEQAAARRLRAGTRYPVPEPVALGEPGPGYPMPWSVQTWLPGRIADPTTGAGPGGAAFARDLARLVGDLRALGTDGVRFADRGLAGARGGELADHDPWVQECLRQTRRLNRERAAELGAEPVDVEGAADLWERCRALPRRRPDATTHGDLIPANLLVGSGRLVGVLDVGGVGPADPALDLVAGWHLCDADARRVFRAELAAGPWGEDDLDWARGQGWALEQALGLVWYYPVTNPPMAALGRSTLRRLLEASPGG